MPDTRRPDLRGHRPARPDQDRARGAVPGAARRHADARPQPGQLLRRDRAGRVPRRAPSCPASSSTDDPLLHARLFSYLDTQITRLGGPNFDQIPINRPAAPVNDNHRDGFGQQAIHTGRAPYAPNSIGGGCPFAVGDRRQLRARARSRSTGIKVRERAAVVRRPLQPGDALLEQHDAAGARPHRRRLLVRARQLRVGRRGRADAREPRERRCRALCVGVRAARAARAERKAGAGCRELALRCR